MSRRAPSGPPATAPAAAAAPAERRETTWDFISEHLNDIVILADRSGTVFYSSPSARRLGYAQSELIGLGPADLVHPDDLPHFAANTAELAALAPGAPIPRVQREHRIRCKDGSWVWLEGNPTPLWDGEGQVVGVLNVFRDVTEQRRIREALWDEARRASMAEAVAGVGYWRLDAATRQITWSQQMFAMYGLQPGDEPPLEWVMAMIHPDDRDAAAGRLEKAMATGQGWRDEVTRLVRPDGEVRYVNGRAICETEPDGRVSGVFGTMIDVTEETLTRMALGASERRYRLLAENTTDIISRTCVRTGRITYLSPSVARVTGYHAEELMGRSMADFVHPEDRAEFLKAFGDLLNGERPVGQAIRFRAQAKGGAWMWLESNPRVLFGVDGAPEHLIDVTRDVGAQEQLKTELREAVAEAERLAAVKSEFLANMSHEIRTPLTAVLGFTSLLAERGDLAPEARAHVERVASAGRSLLAIVNDVLDFSKLEAGHVTLAPKPTPLRALVSETVELFERQAEGKGLALRFEVAGSLPAAVRVDADRVRQVLVNLIGNAVKFTERGGVAVRVAYDDATERLRVEVADTGPGVPAALQEKLFQRFTQGDSSSTRAKGGTGLGLAISRKLAEAMDGALTLRSRVGRGSTFRLELPASRVAAEAAPAAGILEGMELLDGVRVLVCDDNPINRELARAILEPAGVEVSEACDGNEGVEAAGRLPVDLILMDIRMPKLDGLQATWAIRRTPGPNQDVPILAFSADSEANAAGGPLGPFSGRVAKPVSPAALLTAVAEAMSAQFGPQVDVTQEELSHGLR